MGKTTRTITISVPQEVDQDLEELTRLEGRSRSELVREALRRYVSERLLQILSQDIGQKAQDAGITSEEQINELVSDQRRCQ